MRSTKSPPLLPFLGICQLISGELPPPAPDDEAWRQAVFAKVASLFPTSGTIRFAGSSEQGEMHWAASEVETAARGIPGMAGWFHFTAFDGSAVTLPVVCNGGDVWVLAPGSGQLLGTFVPRETQGAIGLRGPGTA